MGGSTFICGLVTYPDNCRECPVISFLLGLMIFGYSLVVNLVYFFLLIPVKKPSIRIFTAMIVCLLPTFIWKFLWINYELVDLSGRFINLNVIISLLCASYVFIRTCREKKITTS